MSERRAILIGASSYEYLPALPMVENQVHELAAVLEEPDSGGYVVESVINPPLRELRSAFADNLQTSRAGDVLVFYYAGHGLMSDSAQFFLTGTDADPDHLRKTGYAAEELGKLLDASAASTVLVFIDACYSGSMLNPVSSISGAAGSDPISSGDPYRRRAVITSSTDLELANYDNTGSIFTSALIAALKGDADLNHDGVIDIDELYTYVSSSLRESGPPQLPTLAVKGDGGAPAIVRVPGMRVSGLVVPSLFVQAAGGASAAGRLLGLPDDGALEGAPDPAMVRRLEDVNRVIRAAADVWDETVIVTWLRSNNGHLGGARPIDALVVHGPEPVLAALDAEAEGVFA